MPENFWDATAGKVKDEFGQHYSEIAAFKAAEESKRLTLPAKPEEYKAELPKDFEVPKGPDGKPIEFKFNEADPALALVKQYAHESGLSQDQFSKLLSVYAGQKVAETQTFANARTAELNKLGANASARMTSINTWLDAQLGDDAKPLKDSIWTAAAAQAYEKLMDKWSSQGAGRFSQQHRDGGPTEKIPGYDKMTFEQKRAAGEARRQSSGR